MSPVPPPPAVVVTDSDLGDVPGSIASMAPTAGPARVSWWKIGAMGAVGLAGCAYVAFYDPNSSGGLYPSCPFKLITGLDCPGCGITRALHALVTGDVGRALDHNLLFVLAIPVLLWWMVRGVIGSTSRRPPGPAVAWRNWLTWALVTSIGLFWAVRNLPLGPFEWLASAAS